MTKRTVDVFFGDTCTTTTPAPSEAPTDELRTLVEVDRRRGSIGLHVASDLAKSARTSSSLWLAPGKAEALANELLAAVASWRQHEVAVATVACELMQQAADDIRAVLALSPTLREVVARIEANKSPGAPYERRTEL